MDKSKLQKLVKESKNPIVKGMWENALTNADRTRRNVTWDNYYLVTGWVLDTKTDKRALAAKSNRW